MNKEQPKCPKCGKEFTSHFNDAGIKKYGHKVKMVNGKFKYMKTVYCEVK